MIRQYFNTMGLKKSLLLLLVCAIAFTVSFNLAAKANEPSSELTAYVLCQPGDYVLVRSTPSMKGNEVGFLDPTDEIVIDVNAKNGFFPIISPTFDSREAYISCRYVSTEKPVWKDGHEYVVVSNERLMARKWIDGPRRQWLVNGSEVRVYWYTPSWSVTNKGFVKSKYLEEW